MDWIKKNYDRFALLVLAFILLVSSLWLIVCAHGFSSRFANVLTEPPHGKKINNLETEALQAAEVALTKPVIWGTHNGSLFVSRKYIGKQINANQYALIDPLDATCAPLHPPIPNKWFFDHGLGDAILDSDALDQDPDKDGFSNLDEFLGKTNPQDAQSHPGYLTKLRLKRYIKVPSRIKFEAYDDTDANSIIFQINTVDIRQPSQFLKIGDIIAGTKYKIIKFEKKHRLNQRTEVDEDVSVLTVEHEEAKDANDLVLHAITDIPGRYAQFAFLWDRTEFSIKKDQKFTLKPEPGIEYKLIDIQDAEAVITNLTAGNGEQIKIPLLENAAASSSAGSPVK